VEWCSSTTLTKPSLGGMAQRGLGDGCSKMDSRCRRHGGIDGKFDERLRFGLAPWSWVGGKRGEGDLWSLCTRRLLWISPGSPRWQ
jgi:hypothetical protein